MLPIQALNGRGSTLNYQHVSTLVVHVLHLTGQPGKPYVMTQLAILCAVRADIQPVLFRSQAAIWTCWFAGMDRRDYHVTDLYKDNGLGLTVVGTLHLRQHQNLFDSGPTFNINRTGCR